MWGSADPLAPSVRTTYRTSVPISTHRAIVPARTELRVVGMSDDDERAAEGRVLAPTRSARHCLSLLPGVGGGGDRRATL